MNFATTTLLYLDIVYTLRITGLTAQQNMEQLVKVLLRVPGLSSQQISAGLKIPPFTVLSVEHESQAMTIKSALEKFGAICAIDNSAAPKTNYESTIPKIVIKSEEDKNKIPPMFWVIIAVVLIIALFKNLNSDSDNNSSKPAATQRPQAPAAQNPAKAEPTPKAETPASKAETPAPRTGPAPNYAARNKKDLSGTLSRNPYNTGAWKALYEKLDREGDTASARKAKESYDRALRAQLVLASLAKTFGNGTRVEVEEEAVYYRTSKDLTDSEFYYEAEKLRESLNEKFPTKDMVLENYKPDNSVQTIRLKANYKN